MSLLSASLILILLLINTKSYRILKYSKYRYSTSLLKNTNSSSLPNVDLSNEDLLDYFQEAKPSKTYNVMDNFRDAKFSGIDNKILTFPMDSYPVRDMISMTFQRK